jgi:3-deoxy-manno-octulosonate cytidylyltransferase (CMP-KDO synthetase)
VISTDSIPHNNVVVVIPARFASTRLPGKPLLEIQGQPIILHVVRRSLAARNVGRVIVATDDPRIYDAVVMNGFEAMMTAVEHPSGTDRLAEVAARVEEAEVVVNVQGDEPMISPVTIERVVDEMLNADEADIVTAYESVESADEVVSPDCVKVVVDRGNRALYFSRSPIPFPRDEVRQYGSLDRALAEVPALLKHFKKHSGIYAYRRGFLLQYSKWPQSKLEKTEALEQLRALERGAVIKVVEAAGRSVGIDTQIDLERARSLAEADLQRGL